MARTPTSRVTRRQPSTTGTHAIVAGISSSAFPVLGAGAQAFGSLGIPNPVSGLVGAAGGAVITALRPYMKLAAGGVVLIASGAALVFVAGSKTQVGQAAGNVAGAVPGGGTAVKVATTSARATSTPKRPDVLAAREAAARTRTARVSTAESRALTARSEARVSRSYATEARAARQSKVLPRIKGPANRPGGRGPKRTGIPA